MRYRDIALNAVCAAENLVTSCEPLNELLSRFYHRVKKRKGLREGLIRWMNLVRCFNSWQRLMQSSVLNVSRDACATLSDHGAMTFTQFIRQIFEVILDELVFTLPHISNDARYFLSVFEYQELISKTHKSFWQEGLGCQPSRLPVSTSGRE
jgi:hypothetical protein